MHKGYGICLNEWLFNNDLKNELRLLLYISSLTAQNGECYAGNQHFAKVFNERPETISSKVSKLKDMGLINIEYERKGTKITKRKIRLNSPLFDGYDFSQRSINKNLKDNNTMINNNNNVNKDIVEKVVEYLNLKTGKFYRPNTNATIRLINGRISDGYKLEDFITVIDVKTEEWLGKEHEKYLRPATLFSATHFESYLNQKPTKPKIETIKEDIIYAN